MKRMCEYKAHLLRKGRPPRHAIQTTAQWRDYDYVRSKGGFPEELQTLLRNWKLCLTRPTSCANAAGIDTGSPVKMLFRQRK
jgi:hypothetical protein